MTMTPTEERALTLVSIDPKALEHACLSAGRSVHHFDRMGDDLPLRASIVAHARAIEQLEATEARHAAEMQELKERFSEAVWEFERQEAYIPPCLAPFIIPAPDPLDAVAAYFKVDRAEVERLFTENGLAVSKIGDTHD